jgi:hypothetical protein
LADELKDQRVVTMMSPTELETIDDWAFRNRIRSRGEAIRRLCQMGLAADRAFVDFDEQDAFKAAGSFGESVNRLFSAANDEDLREAMAGIIHAGSQMRTLLIHQINLRFAIAAFSRGGSVEDDMEAAADIRQQFIEMLMKEDATQESKTLPMKFAKIK